MTQTSTLFRWDGTYWGFLFEDRLYDRHGHHVGWLERAPHQVDVFDRSGRFLGQLVDGRYVLRNVLREEPVHRAPRPAIPDTVPPAPEPDHEPRVPREHWHDALPWPLPPPDPPSL
jgi:hypothetical protein